jgi:hypothetical protein
MLNRLLANLDDNLKEMKAGQQHLKAETRADK